MGRSGAAKAYGKRLAPWGPAAQDNAATWSTDPRLGANLAGAVAGEGTAVDRPPALAVLSGHGFRQDGARVPRAARRRAPRRLEFRAGHPALGAVRLGSGGHGSTLARPSRLAVGRLLQCPRAKRQPSQRAATARPGEQPPGAGRAGDAGRRTGGHVPGIAGRAGRARQAGRSGPRRQTRRIGVASMGWRGCLAGALAPVGTAEVRRVPRVPFRRHPAGAGA